MSTSLQTVYQSERRKEVRYPIHMPSTAGTVVDISSHGLCVAGCLQLGKTIEVQIEWPVLLHGRTPLWLHVYGEPVRCDGQVTGIRIEKYGFRTRRGTPLV